MHLTWLDDSKKSLKPKIDREGVLDIVGGSDGPLLVS